MLGKCFSVLCVIALIFGLLFGNMGEVSKSILEGADKSVKACISLIGIMALWNGIMEVLTESGIIKGMSRILKPVLRLVFPSAFKSGKGSEEITACVSAGVLGVSNAVTPLAINAVSKMERGKRKCYATNDMIMLCMVGSSCFNIVPTTIIAIRQNMGATYTDEISVPVWICSGVCMIIGIILCRLLGRINGDS